MIRGLLVFRNLYTNLPQTFGSKSQQDFQEKGRKKTSLAKLEHKVS